MSIAITQPEQYTCEHRDCNEEVPEPNLVRGQYCSLACADRADGQTVIDHLRRDHRFCATCLRPRKVVYRPADRDVESLRRKALLIRESFVGFEELTEFAELGEHGIECECGAIAHDTPLLDRDGGPWEWWLARAVEQLRHEGQWEYRVDVPTLADAAWETDDLELAVGHALSTPE